MRKNRILRLLAAAILLSLGAGCQTLNRGGDAAGSGPSRSFGLDYVPPQSEPPLESSNVAKAEAGKGAVKSANLSQSADDAPSKSGKGLSRLLPRREQDPPKSKPLPISSRSTPSTESAEGAPQ